MSNDQGKKGGKRKVKQCKSFINEHYAVAQDHEHSTKLADHYFNVVTHFFIEISKAFSEARNASTKLRHDKTTHAQVPYTLLLSRAIHHKFPRKKQL